MRFEVLTAVNIKITDIWHLTPGRSAHVYQYFRLTSFHQLHSPTLYIEAARSSKTFVSFEHSDVTFREPVILKFYLVLWNDLESMWTGTVLESRTRHSSDIWCREQENP